MGDASLRGRSKILKKTYGPYTKTKEQSVEIGKQSEEIDKKSKKLWPIKQSRMPRNKNEES